MDEYNESREEQGVVKEEAEQANVIETESEMESTPVSGGSIQGTVHIAEDVIVELAKKTLQTVPGVQPANPGIASKLGIGRKASDGIRVAVEEGKPPVITVDVYVLVKYGLRIPDVAWDVQESVKSNLEQYTGYSVKAVNINVQGVFFEGKKPEIPPQKPLEKEIVEEQEPSSGPVSPEIDQY
jgi:uncharacterized alkaline shock family protein YloU